jgi:hypothetical protein
VLDLLFLAPTLSNFELELYRAASVTFPNRFFLFYISVDEQVLYVGYLGLFLLSAILFCSIVSLLRNIPDNLACQLQRAGCAGARWSSGNSSPTTERLKRPVRAGNGPPPM